MKIKTQESAHPRPRAHVGPSRETALRNTSRLEPEKSVQATIRSQAGSPTARPPKSTTPLSLPCWTSRFPGARSPWIQTGGPCHTGSPKATSHAALTARVSSLPSKARIASRVRLSRSADGTDSTGKPAHRGNCSARSRRTKGTSMSTSSACILERRRHLVDADPAAGYRWRSESNLPDGAFHLELDQAVQLDGILHG